MRQPTLFPPETPVEAASWPLARADDPATSHQAAEEITVSGTRAHMSRVAYALLTEHPGSTASELDHAYAKRTGGPADGSIRKRLNDLRRAGQAEVRSRRRCRVSGKVAQVWYPLPYRGRIYNAEKAATPARPGNANAKKRGGQNVHCVSADDKTSEKLAREFGVDEKLAKANVTRESLLPNSSIRQALTAIASEPKKECVQERRTD